jgi:hypothetical protein
MRTRSSIRIAAVLAAIAASMAIVLLAADDEPRRSGGIDWPRGQLLPQFAPLRSLDVVDMADRSGEDRLLFATLQGVVNRERPRVYLTEDADEGDEAWPSTFTVPQRRVADPWTLVERYRDELRGIVVYDPALPDSINVATTLAGLRDAVVASPQLAERLSAKPYDLPVLDDLRGRFNSRIDAYRWQYEHLWERTTHRMLIGVSPYRGEGFRFADGAASIVYRFDVPAAARALAATVEIWNQFKVSASTDAADWHIVLQEQDPVRDASNRDDYAIDLSRFAGASTLYLRFEDALPADGWGAAIRSIDVTADGADVAHVAPATPSEQAYIGAEQGTQLSGIRPDGLLRDYAVANRAMAVWLDPNVPEDRALLERILAAMPENSAYVGWFAQDVQGENSGVELASRHAKFVVPADWASSLTVHSAHERLARQPTAPPARRLEDKTYVAFFMTEGDNLQYNQHRLRALWDDPARGTVPISWSTSPLMLDAGRHMLNHYWRTATPNDYLLAGPTGAGYVFPEPFPDAGFRRFARISGEYMREAGLTSLYGLNREAGVDAALSPADARAVVDHMRPEGVALNLFFDRSVEHGRLPRGTPLTTGPIATTVEQGKAQVRDAIAGCAARRPCFVTLGVLSWSMGPTQLAEIAASLGDNVELVRGDHHFELMRAASDDG